MVLSVSAARCADSPICSVFLSFLNFAAYEEGYALDHTPESNANPGRRMRIRSQVFAHAANFRRLTG
jgi:hypothetical protein